MEVVASLSQGRTAAAQCGLFTHESVPVIFEPPCMIKNVYRSCRIQVVIVRYQSNVNFLDIFSKNIQISNLMKIRLVGAEFIVDRQTDRHDEANGRFSQFCERT